MSQEFNSNGKLLLSGEYAVLEGAIALSIPTKYGQRLRVEKANEPHIIWKSFDNNNSCWFETEFFFDQKTFLKNKDPENKISNKLIEILQAAKKLNPNFLSDTKGYTITTHLDFPRDWGLGTSSTLINNIANWANVNAHQLLKDSFGGSGYDIASASNDTPILYQLSNSQPIIKPTSLDWNFTSSLYFIHLNKKQNSNLAIQSFRSNKKPLEAMIEHISLLSHEMVSCTSLSQFESLLQKHEASISEIIQQKTIKEQLFNDYQGAIKSLGAWGGDFILATGNLEDMDYFRNKGYTTIIPFNKMILKPTLF